MGMNPQMGGMGMNPMAMMMQMQQMMASFMQQNQNNQECYHLKYVHRIFFEDK